MQISELRMDSNWWKLHAKFPIISHYGDVIMSAMASEITSFTIVYSTVYSGADDQKSPLLGEFTGEFPTQRPVTRKMFPFDDIIMHTTFSSSNAATQSTAAIAKKNIYLKRVLNTNLVKSRLPITYFFSIQSFWNFAQCSELSQMGSV